MNLYDLAVIWAVLALYYINLFKIIILFLSYCLYKLDQFISWSQIWNFYSIQPLSAYFVAANLKTKKRNWSGSYNIVSFRIYSVFLKNIYIHHVQIFQLSENHSFECLVLPDLSLQAYHVSHCALHSDENTTSHFLSLIHCNVLPFRGVQVVYVLQQLESSNNIEVEVLLRQFNFRIVTLW